ncbi:Uncharacterized protein Adt_46516 [Abeliophyllum distichum]|uniref:Reverse transcriptase domain-containing protein n=1 Tax=Abeliophyllum distichum TaxID=126358 RepID=A0ABD1NZF8_9LAMI
MKFPMPGGVDKVRKNQTKARGCYMNALQKVVKREGIAPAIMTISSEPMDVDHKELDEGLDPRIMGSDSLTQELKPTGSSEKPFTPQWVSNLALVRKSTKRWRVCIDFSDLNQACPKDSFPLPRIDQLVDATAGHKLLSFMDAYSGYNQIPMFAGNEDHTSFITDLGLYCYRMMPFDLKNAGATYQRLVNRMFVGQIGNNMEVYVDDMLVKSVNAKDHIGHLRGMFEVLRKYQMKLNPLKCAFGVASEKFLGYMVNQRRIEANPEKIQALIEMRSPIVSQGSPKPDRKVSDPEPIHIQGNGPLLVLLSDHQGRKEV